MPSIKRDVLHSGDTELDIKAKIQDAKSGGEGSSCIDQDISSW